MAIKWTLKQGEDAIDAKKSNAGRKKLPPGQKREGKHAYLYAHLIEWITTIGNGNFSTGIEIIAKRAGYKEPNEESKPMVTRRQRRLDNELPACVLEAA